MPPIDSEPAPDPRKRAFFGMNAVAFVLMAIAAILAWWTDAATSAAGLTALLLTLIAIGLAIGSYPFYRAFMRDEVTRRATARRSKPRS